MIPNRLQGPRFAIGDVVYYVPGNAVPRSGPERFAVVAILPPDISGACQYRIRPIGAGPHRIATEHQLRH